MTNEKQIQAEIQAELDTLTGEYLSWLQTNGLDDLGSADEHLFDPRLSDEQRKWIRDFSNRWEQAAPIYSGGSLTSRKRMGI